MDSAQEQKRLTRCLFNITAASVNSENPTRVYDLEGEDFFERFNLKRVKVLGKGMAGEVFLVKPKSGSGRMLAVKKFSLLEDVRERSMRQFSTEAGVVQHLPSSMTVIFFCQWSVHIHISMR
ncbi:hypothetical protein RRG08_040450 [Elysia crispata]|uniref:Protein kinase domain-containing protein n=1 Tax=Elysia crispata TaxID=231223 RepID=A0AAE0ZDU4_9GAST|nr:hypothetical protein RRG08_040450 [Elysia crispata]